jgi:hypothetical protein
MSRFGVKIPQHIYGHRGKRNRGLHAAGGRENITDEQRGEGREITKKKWGERGRPVASKYLWFTQLGFFSTKAFTSSRSMA